jgi:hypothetical protein
MIRLKLSRPAPAIYLHFKIRRKVGAGAIKINLLTRRRYVVRDVTELPE